MHSPTPDNNQSRTGQGPFQDCFTGPALCCHRTSTVLSLDPARTMHGPCMHHALTMLSSNQARTELRPYCDRALTITALEPCRNWTVQGPCKDRAGTMQGPCCNRSFTVLSPCHNRTVAEPGKTMLLPAIVRHTLALKRLVTPAVDPISLYSQPGILHAADGEQARLAGCHTRVRVTSGCLLKRSI